uniref:Uncharacterized protein n=1 Tax=Oryza brachyantha TaxID=4533 RepID=J3LCV0_ORYBR
MTSSSRPAVPASGNAPLIGREKDKSQLIQLISQNSKQQRQIISIWGMIGIGKTSFARSVYESEKICSMFEQRAWVTISHPFSPHEFATSLAVELGAQDDSSVHGNVLQKRSCFLVLDGVLSTEEWDLIQPHLPVEANTKIIVTTAQENVAKHCSMTGKDIHKLEGLAEDAALALFKNKVFMDNLNIDLDLDMTTQAKLIIKECDGHPLAITNITDLLVTKPKTATEWKKISDSFSVGSGNKALEMIRAALAPSGDDLPYHLKLCLVYLSVFPKGYNIRRKRLIRRWVAEGYTSKTRHLSAEEVSENCFEELINRSVIQPSKTLATYNVGTVKYYQVHSLIHHISFSISVEENHGFVVGGSSHDQDTIRHLSVTDTCDAGKNTLENKDLSHVRSMTVFGEWRSSSLDFSKMRLLWVLDLEGTTGLRDHDLKQIGNLLHLRYLSLRGCTDIYHLPDSVGNLWDLLMLDVSGTSIIKLPKTITKLKKLQYLRAGNAPNDNVTSSSELKESKDLSKKLQESIAIGLDMVEAYRSRKNHTNHVKKHDIYHKGKVLLTSIMLGEDLEGVEAPDGIGKLSVLHTIGVVNVTSNKAILGELEKLTQLRKLGLTGINKKNSQSVLSVINNLALLHSLSLQIEGEQGLLDNLDQKFSPPAKLQSLKICGNLVTLPIWIAQIQHLSKLKLLGTQLELARSMDVLEKLPHLAILQLWKNSFQGEKLNFFFQYRTFQSLQVLELADLDGLKSVSFMQGAVPRLELLQVKSCMHIENNGLSGLSFPPNLREVMINGDYNDKFMENVLSQLSLRQNQPIVKRA